MKVLIPSALRSYTEHAQAQAAGETLAALLDDLDRQYAGIRFRMIDEQDRIRRHIRIFVNGMQIHDLHISMSGSLATALMLHRTTGLQENGQRVDYWVRATVSCQRLDGAWRITHEHVSLPIESGLLNQEILESRRGA